MKSNFITTDSVRLKLGALLKQISIFLLSCIVAFTSPLCLRASEPTTTPSGSSSGEYVTVQVPLAWTTDRFLSYEDGGEIASESGSITGFIKIIPDAQYTVSQTRKGVVNGSNAFYYDSAKGYINFQVLWNNVSTLQTVAMTVPAGCEYFRLTSDLNITGNSTQQDVYLAITVTAEYLEEHDLTEETLIDVVYKDEDTTISDSADNFSNEYDILHEQEDYLLNDSEFAFTSFFTSFNFDVLEEYLDGFLFVNTWFGNLYSSHDAVIAMSGLAIGLTILFVLLRFRGR